MRRAFTLVELLVVLGVLAVLAGVLLPVFARALAHARTTTCTANLRQLGAAFTLYAQDHDERLPDFRCDPRSAARAGESAYWHDRFCCGLSPEPEQVTATGLVVPYLRAPQVARCPADGDGAADGRGITSYEYKLWLAEGRSLAAVPAAAGMALLWEQWGYHWDDGHASEYERRAAMNILFVDGHVRWRRLADATTARYGSGPDLHGLFRADCPKDPLYGLDFEQ